MRKYLLVGLILLGMSTLNSCTIETTKKSDGIKIEITTDDELVINGEKINSIKAERKLRKLMRELEKEGLSKEEIKSTLNSGKESLEEAIKELNQKLEELKRLHKQEKETF